MSSIANLTRALEIKLARQLEAVKSTQLQIDELKQLASTSTSTKTNSKP